MRIDVRPNDKSDQIKKRHPNLMRQEGLRERQRNRRGHPRDFHDRHEARAHGGADLVEGARARDQGHGGEVDEVLDGGDLSVSRG